MGFVNRLSAALQVASVSIIGFTFIDTFCKITTFRGESMLPTLSKETVALRESFTVYEDYKKGDLVTAILPSDPKKQIIKRITAVEGDIVTYSPRKTKLVDPNDASTQVLKHTNARVIPRGHVWLEGDNELHSLDSRQFGPVPTGLITGRLWAFIYPMSQAKFFWNRRRMDD